MIDIAHAPDRFAPVLRVASTWVSLSGFLAGLLFLIFVAGCASAELRAYEAARDDYEACLSEHPEAPDRCNILRDAASRRYAEYEEAARTRSGSRRPDRDDPWAEE